MSNKRGMNDFIIENRVQLMTTINQLEPVFRETLEKHGVEDFVLSAYKFLDMFNFVTEIDKKISCSSGCSYCCHEKVVISSFEAEVINSYVKKNNIKINKADLKLQLEKSHESISWVNRKCALLNGKGECRIYEVRPTLCRIYNSTSEPKFCHTGKYDRKTGTLRIVETVAIMFLLVKMDLDLSKYTLDDHIFIHTALSKLE